MPIWLRNFTFKKLEEYYKKQEEAQKRINKSMGVTGGLVAGLNAVAGKFAGVKIGANDDLTQFVGRGRYTTILGNQYGLVVVDGVVIKQSNSSMGDISVLI